MVSKLSSKFNKLLQFQAVEGRAYMGEVALDLTEAECVSQTTKGKFIFLTNFKAPKLH